MDVFIKNGEESVKGKVTLLKIKKAALRAAFFIVI